MRTSVIFLSVFFCLCTRHGVGLADFSTCEPAKAGQTYRLVCQGLQMSDCPSVIWNKDQAANCVCTVGAQGPCHCTDDKNTATLTREGTKHTSSLTILQPHKDLTGSIWTCNACNKTYMTCRLYIYAEPQSVTCVDPDAHMNGTVTVQCRVEDVYPSAASYFHIRSNYNANETELKPTFCLVTQVDSVLSYTCTLQVSAIVLDLGTHAFQLVVYPVINGNEFKLENMSASSNWTKELVIEPPEIAFAGSTCPQNNSFVPEGQEVICYCVWQDQSNLPTCLEFTGLSQSVCNGGVQLSFNVTRDVNELTCRANNSIGMNTSVTLIFAGVYGPDNVELQVESSLQLCDRPVSIFVECLVLLTAVSPSLSMSITSNLTNSTEMVVPTLHNGTYNHSQNLTVTSGGLYVITCLAVNSVVENWKKSQTVRTMAIEPPSKPNILIHQDGQSINSSNIILKEGNVSIICEVEGGYPAVSSLTLNIRCPSYKVESSNNTSFIQLNTLVTRAMMNCFLGCVAAHPSSCYNSTANTSPIQIYYMAQVTHFIIVSGSVVGTSQSRKVGDNVTFVCEVEGHPAPNVTIFMKRMPGLVQTTFKPNVQPEDTGIYICEASNGIDSGQVMSKEVELFVQSAQQLLNPADNDQVFVRSNNMTLVIRVIGYPPPEGFKIVERQNNESFDITDGSVWYIPLQPPYGEVHLSISHLKESNYTLFIDNSIGGLVFWFGIKEGNKESDDDFQIGIIVGCVVAGFFLIVIVIGLVMWKRGTLNKKRSSSGITGNNRASSTNRYVPNSRRQDRDAENLSHVPEDRTAESRNQDGEAEISPSSPGDSTNSQDFPTNVEHIYTNINNSPTVLLDGITISESDLTDDSVSGGHHRKSSETLPKSIGQADGASSVTRESKTEAVRGKKTKTGSGVTKHTLNGDKMLDDQSSVRKKEVNHLETMTNHSNDFSMLPVNPSIQSDDST